MQFPMLRMGSFGDVVEALQEALNLWTKSTKPQLDVDGAFGPKTDGKVREFQSRNNLVPDGIVGPASWQALQPLVDQILTLAGPPPRDFWGGGRDVPGGPRRRGGFVLGGRLA